MLHSFDLTSYAFSCLIMFLKFSGKLPEYIFVALLDTEAFIGTPNKSITNYQHFNLSEVSLRVNGEVVQHMVIPYSWAGTDGSSTDDYFLALNNVKSMANIPELGNAISLLNFKKGEFYLAAHT